jgi:hypothetical protein
VGGTALPTANSEKKKAGEIEMTNNPLAANTSRTGPPKKHTTAERRYQKIQKEAYYRAEKDGFRKNPVEYWLAAEVEIKE